MTRKKVKLAWIVNDAARKASLKKRRIGLLKKVSELTTLCGVSAFAIIYSPDESEPVFWPSRPEVEQLLARFQNMSDMERCKKMMNQESYIRERIGKVHEQAKKNHKRNRDTEMDYLMQKIHNQPNGMDDLDLIEQHRLAWLLEEKVKDIRKRVEYFQQSPFPPHGGVGAGANMEEMGGGGGGRDGRSLTDTMTWDQWFIDNVMINNNHDSVTRGSGGMLPLHPYGGSFGHRGGGSVGGIDMAAAWGMGLPHSNMGGNVPPPSLGFYHGNFGNVVGGDGSESSLGLELPSGPGFGGGVGGSSLGLGLSTGGHGAGASGGDGGSDMGVLDFFGGASDIGLPYDVTKTTKWPNNNNNMSP